MAKQKGTKKGMSEKKEKVPVKPKRRPPSMLEPYRPSELWSEFDKAFDRFRRDFENLLWPSERHRELPMMPELETRMPAIDLEDRGDKFVLTVEAPGFKKDEIEINITDGDVEVSACKTEQKDEETEGYIRKERSSESFYRKMALPEEIKVDDAEANLQDGILELVMPKKVPKKKKKVQVK